jgi:hypothetical protein
MEATKLTAESIKGFGHLVHRTSKELTIDEERFSFAADVFKFEDRERLTVGILTGKKREAKLETIERHIKTEELLVQLDNDGVIYLARPSNQTPVRSDIQPFLLKQGEATWQPGSVTRSRPGLNPNQFKKPSSKTSLAWVE